MSETSTVGAWLVQLCTKLFFQPDDSVSSQAFDHGISRDLTVRINGRHFTYDEYRHAVEDARAKNYMSEQSNVELLSSSGDAKESVAQLTSFTLKNKATGQEISSSSAILATVEWTKGRRVLTELTEVTK